MCDCGLEGGIEGRAQAARAYLGCHASAQVMATGLKVKARVVLKCLTRNVNVPVKK